MYIFTLYVFNFLTQCIRNPKIHSLKHSRPPHLFSSSLYVLNRPSHPLPAPHRSFLPLSMRFSTSPHQRHWCISLFFSIILSLYVCVCLNSYIVFLSSLFYGWIWMHCESVIYSFGGVLWINWYAQKLRKWGLKF